jgi:hypothetical protein
MHSPVISTASKAALDSGVGLQLLSIRISPAVKTGFLDVFSVGALLSGICLLAVTSPGRLRRLTRLARLNQLSQRLALPRRPARARGARARARARRAASRRAMPRHASTLGRPVGRHAASSRYSPAGR